MVKSAGRANATVTAVMVVVRGIARIAIGLCAAVSICTVCVAEDQKLAFGSQVAQLTGTAVGGSLTVLIGTVGTPLGAVFAGLTFGMIGSVAGEQFYAVFAGVFLGGGQSTNIAPIDKKSGMRARLWSAILVGGK